MVHSKEPVLPLGNFLFPRIFQAFGIAIRPSNLVIAFGALTILCLTGAIMDLSRTVVVDPGFVGAAPRDRLPPGTPGPAPETRPARGVTELDLYLLPDKTLTQNFIESRKGSVESREATRAGVFATLWRFGDREFHHALYALLSWNVPGLVRSVTNGAKALVWAFRWHTLYSLVFFAVAFVVLSLAGVAICRSAALQFARAERPRLTQAVRFGRRRLLSLLGAEMAPAALVAAFGLPTILLGLVGNIPFAGPVLTGVFLPLSLLVACAAAIVLVGMIGGAGLMAPAIAYEDADGFDAVVRSFLVFSEPWRMGFYALAAALYGAVCYVFVRLFGFLLLWTTYRFLEVGFVKQNATLHAIWPEPTFGSFLGPGAALPDAWYLGLAALLIRLWVLIVVGVMASFVISFYFSASTIIYALLRRRADGIALEEISAGSDPTGSGAAGQAAVEPWMSETGPGTAAPAPTTAMNEGSEPGPYPAAGDPPQTSG
jgi:hypothetical protein